MSWVAVGVAAGSMIMSISAGEEAKKAAGKEADLTKIAARNRRDAVDFEADVLQVQAGQTVAAAQRDALDIQRMTRLALSRVIAVSAASGGGASDSSTVHHIVETVAKEGSYNAQRALYAGEEKARLMNIQALEMHKQGEYYVQEGDLAATAINQRGSAAQTAGYSQALSTAAGMYGKYGGRGWQTTAQQPKTLGSYNWDINV